MHVECWGTGIDFLAVTPYKIGTISNKSASSLIQPLPINFIKGTLSQLGKQYVWQTHGFWFHSFLGFIADVYPTVTSRYRKLMKVNDLLF